MKIELLRPSADLKEKALDYRQEHFDEGEYVINGSELFDKTDNYEQWLESVTKNANPETVNPDWVLTDTFFAYDSDSNQIVGIVDFRHELNYFLKNFGHCGYSVRPSARNQGIATELLAQIVKLAKAAGLSQLQLSVERSNTPSIKTIKKNGGILDRSFEFEGELADIYTITL